MSREVQPCRGCGGEKTAGRKGALYCEACAPVRGERKPCAWCGGEKEPGVNGARYCGACRVILDAWEEALHRCQKCGSPDKLPGRGQRLCGPCHEGRTRNRPMAPCANCGARARKPKQGSRYCVECAPVKEWEAAKKRKIRKARERKPCTSCGGPKEAGTRRRLCDACRAVKEGPRVCRGCDERKVTEPHKRYCPDCTRLAEERRKRQHARLQRERRERDPEFKRRQDAASRRWRRNRSEESRKRARESARLRYRVRALESGRVIRESEQAVLEEGRRLILPVRPWREWVAEQVEALGGREDGGVPRLAEQIGDPKDQEATQRAIHRWLGEAVWIELDAVDAALITLGEPWLLETLYVNLSAVIVPNLASTRDLDPEDVLARGYETAAAARDAEVPA